MALPAWAIALLVLFPLAQIPLVVVLARRLHLGEATMVVTPTMAYWTGESPDPRLVEGAAGVPGRCGRCGVDNDPAYAYCGGCLARL